MAMKEQTGRVLIVESDDAGAYGYGEYLGRRGFTVLTAKSVAEGRTAIETFRPDLTAFAVDLEDQAAVDLIVRAVEIGSHGLVLSRRDEVGERIRVLSLGADDFVKTPIDLEELYLRIRNILSRRSPKTIGLNNLVLELEGIRVDLITRELLNADGTPGSELTESEFLLLRMLAENANRVVTKEALFKSLRGRPTTAATRSLDVAISRLRAKLKSTDADAEIRSVRQLGYFFTPHRDAVPT